MEQEAFEIKMMEYLSGELSKSEEQKLEGFLHEHPERKQEFENLKRMWMQIGGARAPEPSERMDAGFYEMLNAESEKQSKKSTTVTSATKVLLASLFKPSYAFGLVLLGIGLTAGYLLQPSIVDTPAPTTITNVKNSETEQVREKLVLTLLEQPSVTKRLEGVNEVNKMMQVDEQIINALLKTLNNDANVNVRLAAIESLVNYLDNPIVRQGLVQSIVKQDAPIVQISLANVMVALQEKKSIEPFKTLLRTKELDTTVKQRLQTSINLII